MRTISPLSLPPALAHPEQLYLLAHSRGLQTVPPSEARLLVVGPCDGVELINLIQLLPQARWTAAYLSQATVAFIQSAQAAGFASSLSLVETLSEVTEVFDYILAPHHLSQPGIEANSVLPLFAKHLTPFGVVLVGIELAVGHAEFAPLKSYLSTMLSTLEDPSQRYLKARETIALFTRQMGQLDSRRASHAYYLTRLTQALNDTELERDWLQTRILSDMPTLATQAQAADLMIWDGAHLCRERQVLLDPTLQTLLAKLPPSVRASHYLDCFERIKRREILLCHQGLISCALDQSLPAEQLAHCHLVSLLSADPWSVSSRFQPSITYSLPQGELTLTNDTLRIALSALYHEHPRSLPFETLFKMVLGQMHEEHLSPELLASEGGRSYLRQRLLEDLTVFVHRDLVLASLQPYRNLTLPRRLPEHWHGSEWLRWLLPRLPVQAWIPNQHHRLIQLSSEERRHLLSVTPSASEAVTKLTSNHHLGESLARKALQLHSA